MKNREGYYVTDTERECTKCGVVFKKTSKTVAICPTCNSKRVTEQSPETKMYRRAKSRASQKGIVFSITKEDVVIPDRCPILGIKLEASKGKSGGKKNSPALDRKNPSLGYEKGNIWVISHLANMMKSSATETELKAFADWVYKVVEK